VSKDNLRDYGKSLRARGDPLQILNEILPGRSESPASLLRAELKPELGAYCVASLHEEPVIQPHQEDS
jgi:hypothetical protein